MPLRSIPANEYRRERWRNGLGWTREIARSDMRSDDWDWRLSIAEVDSDCAFSAFPGFDRVLLLLTGNGMELAFDDGEVSTVEPPHGRIAFAGERSLQCRLLDGATTDFNAMARRDRCTMQVFHRPLVGSMVFFAEAGALWAIHLIGGRATIKSAEEAMTLNAGDTALFDASSDGTTTRAILDGGGDLILVKIQRDA